MPVITRAVANAMFRFCMRLAIVYRDDELPQEAESALLQAIRLGQPVMPMSFNGRMRPS